MNHSIANMRSLLEDEITRYSSTLKGTPNELYEPLSYMLLLGGKRLRPLLVLLGCDLFDENPDKALKAALAMEVFHNFTLIHDDIMDNAPLRRNKETVFKKWNSNIAILSGDALMIKAYELLTLYDKETLHDLLILFNKTALEVCEGQQLDMNYETLPAAIPEYLKMIELKTAVLLAACLKTGALIAGASSDNQENLYSFGKNIGIAFQLKDDLLDAFGEPEKFGKMPGGDIIANKKTFLYLRAFEAASQEDKMQLEQLYSSAQANESKVEKVMNIFMKYKAKEALETEMEKYFSEGKAALLRTSGNSEKIKSLLSFAEDLMNREV
jgi:geranylgeranyl diphosphate synthase, type II